MLLTCSRHPRWLSNTWAVAAAPGGDALLIDAGGPLEPLLPWLEQHALTPRLVLLTHHHPDHVAEVEACRRRWGARVAVHASEADLVPVCDQRLEGGEELEPGGLAVRALHIPGHTRGQLAFLVDGRALFTGDTLFRGSVGGTRGPGHTTLADLRRSLLEVLFRLPLETEVYPGHMEPTTLAREWAENPFVRAFRGLDAPGAEACRVRGQPATLLLWARDYDGGGKAWVRFPDGQEDVVPGSAVERGP